MSCLPANIYLESQTDSDCQRQLEYSLGKTGQQTKTSTESGGRALVLMAAREKGGICHQALAEWLGVGGGSTVTQAVKRD